MATFSRLELAAKLEFLRGLVAETRAGKHDGTIQGSREEVCENLERYISEGEQLYSQWTESEASKN